MFLQVSSPQKVKEEALKQVVSNSPCKDSLELQLIYRIERRHEDEFDL